MKKVLFALILAAFVPSFGFTAIKDGASAKKSYIHKGCTIHVTKSGIVLHRHGKVAVVKELHSDKNGVYVRAKDLKKMFLEKDNNSNSGSPDNSGSADSGSSWSDFLDWMGDHPDAPDNWAG